MLCYDNNKKYYQLYKTYLSYLLIGTLNIIQQNQEVIRLYKRNIVELLQTTDKKKILCTEPCVV